MFGPKRPLSSPAHCCTYAAVSKLNFPFNCFSYVQGAGGVDREQMALKTQGPIKDATGWTGVDMSTPLSSGRYSFLSKNDIKVVWYTFWTSILSLFHPTFSGLAPLLGLSISRIVRAKSRSSIGSKSLKLRKRWM